MKAPVCELASIEFSWRILYVQRTTSTTTSIDSFDPYDELQCQNLNIA